VFIIHPDFEQLIERARRAPEGRRWLARVGLTDALLVTAFTMGGVLQQYPVCGSLLWAAYHGGALALILIGVVSLVESWLPKGAAGVVTALAVGALALGPRARDWPDPLAAALA
jgi:hypothetical protein